MKHQLLLLQKNTQILYLKARFFVLRQQYRFKMWRRRTLYIRFFKDNTGYGWVWAVRGKRIGSGSLYRTRRKVIRGFLGQVCRHYVDKIWFRIYGVDRCISCGQNVYPKWHPYYTGNFHWPAHSDRPIPCSLLLHFTYSEATNNYSFKK